MIENSINKGSDFSNLSDEEIAKKVQEGGTELFEILVLRYQKRLFRYAKKFLFLDQEAEDLLQDIFLKAYTNIRSFNPNKKFSPWIYRIAHNEFINSLKKKEKNKFLSFDLDIFLPYLFSKDEADLNVTKQELTKEMNHCLSILKAKYREVVVLYFYEEFDYKEISDVLKIPISTVGVRLKRAKEQIKKCLSN